MQQEYFEEVVERYRNRKNYDKNRMAQKLSLTYKSYIYLLDGRLVLEDEDFNLIQERIAALKLADYQKEINLKLIRQRHNIKQSELAMQLGLELREIKEIENNDDPANIEKRKIIIKYIKHPKETQIILFNLYYNRALLSVDKVIKDSYVVLDFEYTQGNRRREAIEIGAIKYVNGVAKEKFHYFLRPTVAVTPIVEEMTGINDFMLRHAPKMTDVMPLFLEFIGDLPIVMHSARDDIRFVWEYQYGLNLPMIHNEIIDTLTLSQKMFAKEEVGNYRLDNLKNYFGMSIGSHNAIDDCKVTSKLFESCKERLLGVR